MDRSDADLNSCQRGTGEETASVTLNSQTRGFNLSGTLHRFFFIINLAIPDSGLSPVSVKKGESGKMFGFMPCGHLSEKVLGPVRFPGTIV